MQQLQSNTTLQSGKYKIIRTLGQGGFGITYLAEQVMLDRKVAIKEFFMKEYCDRDESTSRVTMGSEGSRESVNRYREKFLKEARNIAKLSHPNIVKIIDVFEENDTAYYVMEYVDGGSLAEKIKREGYLSEPVATRYIMQVAEALAYVHERRMNHLDVKPDNIMLTETDTAVLIDFGLSKQYNVVGKQTSTTPVGISEGYAPMEQYMQGGVSEFSPETDIYALGATFFKMLTGITPPSASYVNEEGVPVDELKAKGVSEEVIKVICEAMEPRKKERVKEVGQIRKKLQGKGIESIKNEEDEVTRMNVEQPTHSENGKSSYPLATPPPPTPPRFHVGNSYKQVKPNQSESFVKRLAKTLLIVTIFLIVPIIVLIKCNPLSDDNDSDFVPDSVSQPASYSNGVLKINDVTYKMVSVEGGTFTMGATSEMKGAWEHEFPTHLVTVSGFSIGQTEVTQALWKAVMEKNPSHFKGDDYPVERVSWNDCKDFLYKLDSLTGKDFRLPTEAEWEFAAREGNNSNHTKYSGNNNINDVAWYNGNSEGKTHSVAQLQANELGIYDMCGNVWEWCSDWYGDYSNIAQTNPTGAVNGTYRVFRGGDWKSDARYCRSSYRTGNSPDTHYEGLGFRLCLSE